jgi:predicted DNA-binding ribbon-helix-helix protein
MRSSVVKRSVVVAGHKTSVSLEDAFWSAFKEIAERRQITVSELADAVAAGRQYGNLSSAIRLFVLDHCLSEIGAELKARAPICGETRAA